MIGGCAVHGGRRLWPDARRPYPRGFPLSQLDGQNAGDRGCDALPVVLHAFDDLLHRWCRDRQFWWLAYSTGETMAIDSAWGPYCGLRARRCRLVASCLMLQGIPEIFRAFHKMGKERERWFVRVLPIYLIALTWLILAIFAPAVGAGWRMVHGYDEGTSGVVQADHRPDHACLRCCS